MGLFEIRKKLLMRKLAKAKVLAKKQLAAKKKEVKRIKALAKIEKEIKQVSRLKLSSAEKQILKDSMARKKAIRDKAKRKVHKAATIIVKGVKKGGKATLKGLKSKKFRKGVSSVWNTATRVADNFDEVLTDRKPRRKSGKKKK